MKDNPIVQGKVKLQPPMWILEYMKKKIELCNQEAKQQISLQTNLNRTVFLQRQRQNSNVSTIGFRFFSVLIPYEASTSIMIHNR